MFRDVRYPSVEQRGSYTLLGDFSLFFSFFFAKSRRVGRCGYLYIRKFLDIVRGVLKAYYEVRFSKLRFVLKKFDYTAWKSVPYHTSGSSVRIYSSVSKIKSSRSFSCVHQSRFTYKIATLSLSLCLGIF